ncbi:hypothetical protein [Flavobacterium limnophilum]|uniref:hypothetical protein n=1 Tax=Flavobacterium limnophilum TaxID=3003262 RepID=UPI002482BEE6|nr:hypothetical protein [Flavobacterium limnophilum]
MIRNLKPITQNSKKKITSFWNYVRKNEQEIFNGLLLGLNYDQILEQFYKKLSYISKAMIFLIKIPENDQEKYTIIFCCRGYRKIFSKAIALEEQVPQMEKFTAQAFVQPFEEVTKYKNGTDEPFEFNGCDIKISEMQMSLEDYDIARKQLKINIYLPFYNEIKEYKNLENDIHLIVLFILGEMAFYKHIREIKLHPMPLEPVGLLSLIELPDFIDYLYQINSRRKTRKV